MRGLSLCDSTMTTPGLMLMTPRSNPGDGSLPANKLLVDILEAAGIDNEHAEWPDSFSTEAYLVTVNDEDAAEYGSLTVASLAATFPDLQ